MTEEILTPAPDLSDIVTFVVYELSGRILRYGKCSRNLVDLQGEYVLIYDGEPETLLDFNWYVLDAIVVARPAFPVENTVSVPIGEALIVPVPGTATVSVDGAPAQPVTGGSLEISGDVRGSYKLALSGFPYHDKTVEVVIV